MTVGSDVSSLFPDVVNCMQTNSLDLKKLVYLYVINYAKAQPDLAILAIHSFRKDANDPNNPLLRALAVPGTHEYPKQPVRTMGCIRLEQMTEYLLEPLRRSCNDTDPYVRKTATMCVAKLYDINPELVEDQGFLEIVRDMLGDANPPVPRERILVIVMVVANAVASLCEISTSARKNFLKLDEDVISRLLPALNECSEWGQVFILDALAMYDPPNSKVAEAILERGVIARLQHANSAAGLPSVLARAIKVIMKFMDRLSSHELARQHRMTPPLVTMLSAEPEIQYVVMRNINLIVQKQPSILQTDVRMFVCKYNDPLYVKLEKIVVMVQLASERNIDQVLSEFREYASEASTGWVRWLKGRGIGAMEDAAAWSRQDLAECLRSKAAFVRLERPNRVCLGCRTSLEPAKGKWVHYAVCPHSTLGVNRRLPRQKPPEAVRLCRNAPELRKRSSSHLALVKRGERPKIQHLRLLRRCQHGHRARTCVQCHGCEHGKLHYRCQECREDCPHGKFFRHCNVCAGCEHGEVKDSCKKCRGCKHGVLKVACRLCNPCPHGRLKSGCIQCSQCPHQRLRQNCPKCSGCIHGKVWQHCTVDIVVVRHSVRAIGQAAIKIERAAERCVDCLLELIKTKVNYVVQEAIVVIRDIFRKYPGKYEIIISDLCENLDSLDEPDAKAAMIWIVGEYAERIDNSSDLLESFLESFHEEPASVQHQILTATVKMCIKIPQSSRELVGRVLKLCTDESTNPDLRDRGYMYWRMLSKTPELARQVVLSERPTISENSFALQPRVLDRLITNISTLASVYHQVPEAFCDLNRGARNVEEDESEDYSETIQRVQEEIQQTAGKTYEEESGEEVSEEESESSGSEKGAAASGAAGAPPPPLRPLAPVLTEQTPGQQGKVAAAVVRGNGGAVGMQLMVGNFSPQPMSGWAVQMNKNPFGLAPAGPLQLKEVPPNGTAKAMLPLAPNQLASGAPPSMPLFLEVAIKTNVDVFYLSVGYDLSAVLADNGPMAKDAFQRVWTSAPPDKKATRRVGEGGRGPGAT
ncbi:unnamed protein product [Effrenium voratum]|uniref:AP complex subunit beta n=1 Tax=Effrenium voratum TaxID=2562239 RepID=A0AA36MUP1_9DINO|nr:unnamed protein product [Effrenium voratum]